VKKILITGATGQLGSELALYLRDRYGRESVLAAGHSTAPSEGVRDSGPYVTLDVRDQAAIDAVAGKHEPDTIFHLAAILSAMAEEKPRESWDVNVGGLLNVLEVARVRGCSVFFPSSIGAFGPTAPADNTPQETIQRPQTVYGISKVTGELLCDYYFRRYGVDTRGLRYPGLVSYETLPGGGTTDYAVEIFHGALLERHYSCFLKEGTRLDLMYMPDAVRAAAELMEADLSRLEHRNAFNVTAMSVAPEDLAEEIRKSIPEFTMDYVVDPLRQSIAESWPRHMDDSAARREWGWEPGHDLSSMAADMLTNLSARLWKDGYGLDGGF